MFIAAISTTRTRGRSAELRLCATVIPENYDDYRITCSELDPRPLEQCNPELNDCDTYGTVHASKQYQTSTEDTYPKSAEVSHAYSCPLQDSLDIEQPRFFYEAFGEELSAKWSSSSGIIPDAPEPYHPSPQAPPTSLRDLESSLNEFLEQSALESPPTSAECDVDIVSDAGICDLDCHSSLSIPYDTLLASKPASSTELDVFPISKNGWNELAVFDYQPPYLNLRDTQSKSPSSDSNSLLSIPRTSSVLPSLSPVPDPLQSMQLCQATSAPKRELRRLSRLTCPHCQQSFLDNSRLSRHLDEKHRVFQCDIGSCGRVFPDQRTLNRHQKTTAAHNNLPGYQCSCGKSNPRKDHHRRHLRTCQRPLSSRQYQCICGFNSSGKDGKDHYMQHLQHCSYEQAKKEPKAKTEPKAPRRR
ncbi:hypothetical protein BU16DRAFT_541220 [Lophium mytilinum]|uniref:C2H2-type domain-containing protein n=1 Tax=Lophium mytilinum TaxID=390894 RepID=A0A6A6QN74_9PEZI|nr:hypothetical protein BU16DRAFT_541220 [Lophium mytilinum]